MATDATQADASELLAFVDEEVACQTDSSAVAPRQWRILVVDDDPDVHQATLFSLDSQQLFGRPLVFLHAHSAQQARQILQTEADLALILLDVVMETPGAGLDLVDFIRTTAQLTATRIVLRTGQPGYAPEHETILRYDINDYKTKSELTHHKLLTTVTAAIRSYDQLCTIEANRNGLALIVKASAHLLEMQGLQTFAAGVMTQLAALLGTLPEGLVCAQGAVGSGHYTVLAAAGQFTHLINHPLEDVTDGRVREALQQALGDGCSYHGEHETVLYFGQKSGLDMAAYVGTAIAPHDIDYQLLSVFSANLSACLRNLALLQRLNADA